MLCKAKISLELWKGMARNPIGTVGDYMVLIWKETTNIKQSNSINSQCCIPFQGSKSSTWLAHIYLSTHSAQRPQCKLIHRMCQRTQLCLPSSAGTLVIIKAMAETIRPFFPMWMASLPVLLKPTVRAAFFPHLSTPNHKESVTQHLERQLLTSMFYFAFLFHLPKRPVLDFHSSLCHRSLSHASLVLQVHSW